MPASATYQVWMAEAALRRTNGKISTLGEGFEEVYNVWIQELNNFQNTAADYAMERDGKV